MLRFLKKAFVAIFAVAMFGTTTAAPLLQDGNPVPGAEETESPYGKGIRFSSREKITSSFRQKLDMSSLAGKNVIVDGTMRFDNLTGDAYIGLEYTKEDGEKTTFYLRRKTRAGDKILPWVRCIREHRIPAGAKDGWLVVGLANASGSAEFANMHVFADEPLSEEKVEILDKSNFTKCVFPYGITAYRRNNKLIFRFELLDPTEFAPTEEEAARGFVPFRPEEVREVAPGRKIHRDEVLSELKVKSTPGQGQELFLGFGALRPFQKVKVDVGELKSEDGTILPHSIFDLREAENMYIMWGRDYYRLLPRPQYPMREVPASPESPRLFNLLSRLPKDAVPGVYRGTVTITADDQKMELPLTFEVLPFQLVVGKPYMFCYYHKPDIKCYQDMVDHGANSVYLGDAKVGANLQDGQLVMDYSIPDKHIECYRACGMSKEIVFNPFHDRMSSRVLELLGIQKNYKMRKFYGEPHYLVPEGQYPEEAAVLFKKIIGEVFAHMEEAHYPDYMLHLMDEPGFPVDQVDNNPNDWNYRGWYLKREMSLAKEVKPDVRTFSTAYKLPTIEKLRPELDIGCAEIERISREDAINYRRTVHGWGQPFWGADWPAWWDDYVRTRRACGFLPADRKLEAFIIWVYYIPHLHDPDYLVDDFHGGYQQCNYTYLDKEGNFLPTVVFEGIRAGSNDWRYTETLREMLAKMPSVDYWRETKLLDDVLASPRSNDEKREWIIERILLLLKGAKNENP